MMRNERLNAAGITVISFVPTIEKVDTAQGSAYLSVFTREKTPLEKLFQGQKLFLGDDPAGRVRDGQAAVCTAALDAVQGGREVLDGLKDLSPALAKNIEIKDPVLKGNHLTADMRVGNGPWTRLDMTFAAMT